MAPQQSWGTIEHMKRASLSILLGFLMVVSGMVMAQVGGWGPCGPASNLSVIGGWLSGMMLASYAPIPPVIGWVLACIIWSCLWRFILGRFSPATAFLDD